MSNGPDYRRPEDVRPLGRRTGERDMTRVDGRPGRRRRGRSPAPGFWQDARSRRAQNREPRRAWWRDRPMIPHAFDYHAPKTLPDALNLLKQLGDDAKLLAGGHSLLPMMKLRFAQPGHLIDLGQIAELKGIREDGGTLVIGAMTTENEIIWSKLLQQKCPLLVEGARQISDPQVRYKGTIGGDIAHGDPGNDHPALMIALDAKFVLRGAGGERTVPADGFFLGTYDTQMKPDEIMTAIRIPIPAAGSGYCYSKLKRKTGDFAAAAAAVLLRIKGGAVDDVRIALTNVGPTPLRAKA